MPNPEQAARLMTGPSPRVRRLAADYDSVRRHFSGHSSIEVEPLGPSPPEAYRVTFQLPGLQRDGAVPVVVDRHVVTIRLPLRYPAEPAVVIADSPIFHPNVLGHYCVADYWSADLPLVDVICKVADMIQYRVYSVESPLDPVAAHYARQHPELFPLGDIDLAVPDVHVSVSRPGSQQQPTAQEN